MKFFKENSYDIVKLYVNNIGISIFALMLYFAAGNIAKDSVGIFNLVISIFSMLFLMSLVYCAGWDMGAKDKIHIDANRMQFDKHKGVKLALLANIPNFILTFFSVSFLLLYIASNVEGFKVVSAIFDAIMRLSMSLYIGAVQSISDIFALSSEWSFVLEGAFFLVIPVFVILATTIGYKFGVNNFRISRIFSKSQDE